MNKFLDGLSFAYNFVYYMLIYFYYLVKGREFEKGDLVLISGTPHIIVSVSPLCVSYRRVDNLDGRTTKKLFEDLTDIEKML
jgi:hypothetical protein